MKRSLIVSALALASASVSEAQVYYPVPGMMPIQQVYYYPPPAWQTMSPQPMPAQRVYFGGAMTTRGVIPVQNYFANLHREAEQMEAMRRRQAPGTALPPVLPPNLPTDALPTPSETEAPSESQRTPGYLQQLFDSAPPR